jgi:ribosomal protein L22
MAEEIKKQPETKIKQEEAKQEEQKIKDNINKIEDKKDEKKVEKSENKEEKKKVEIKKSKKDFAVANGLGLNISTKKAVDICSMIRARNIDRAIEIVEEVIAEKRPVRMNRREASHQHGKGVMAGGYPIEGCKLFLTLLKQLKSNAIYHELELEKLVLFCKADQASRPYRSGGRRFKRTNVLLKLIKSTKSNKQEVKEKKKA